MQKDIYLEYMDKGIKQLFADAMKAAIANPPLALAMFRVMRYQRKAYRLRQQWESEGLHIPPFMIASITHRCNLNCAGCYAKTLRPTDTGEMSSERLHRLLTEARELGISIVMLAGGEPLVRKDLLDITADFPEIVFPLFTNGLLLDEQIVRRLTKQKNVVPVLSIEGFENHTDDRRGAGVYEAVRKAIGLLKKKSIFWGVSLTVTRENYKTITDEEFVRLTHRDGCKLYFYVEYVPVKEGSESLATTAEENKVLLETLAQMRRRYPGLFIAFPGEEDAFGGCLSAGRGFVHISPDGKLEPCPFAPYSDTNISQMSLKDALQSDFLKAIREHHSELTETVGGCALWEKREWVKSLLKP